MKINRLTLIKKLEQMIVQHEEDMLRRKTEAYTRAGDAETRYMTDQAENWKQFADRIRLKLRKSQPITREDVPEGLSYGGRSSSIDLFRPVTVVESDYIPRNQGLVNLLAVLQASPDETISTSELARIGAPLRELMKP